MSLFQRYNIERTIPQTKVISLFLRKHFRFNYQLLWSEQDQPAFAAFHNHFTTDECLPFIINKQNEHAYFLKPDNVTQQTMDLISFDPRLITENIFHDDKRPYRYELNIQQQNLFTNNDNNNEEDDNNNEEYIFENQNENRNEGIVLLSQPRSCVGLGAALTEENRTFLSPSPSKTVKLSLENIVLFISNSPFLLLEVM